MLHILLQNVTGSTALANYFYLLSSHVHHAGITNSIKLRRVVTNTKDT
jgi:hypothetical protein